MFFNPSCRAGQAAGLGPRLLHLSVCFWLMVRPGDESAGLVLASNARLQLEGDGLLGIVGVMQAGFIAPPQPSSSNKKKLISKSLAFERLWEENCFDVRLHSTTSSAWVFKKKC